MRKAGRFILRRIFSHAPKKYLHRSMFYLLGKHGAFDWECEQYGPFRFGQVHNVLLVRHGQGFLV